MKRLQVGGVGRTAVVDFFSLTCFVSGAGIVKVAAKLGGVRENLGSSEKVQHVANAVLD